MWHATLLDLVTGYASDGTVPHCRHRSTIADRFWKTIFNHDLKFDLEKIWPLDSCHVEYYGERQHISFLPLGSTFPPDCYSNSISLPLSHSWFMAMARYLSLLPSPSYPKLYGYSPLSPIPRETTFLSSACFRTKANTPSFVCSVQNGAVVAVGEDLPLDYGDWFPKLDAGDRRRAGVLLHPTSLRGPYGIGDLGDEAFRFVDWLHAAGCSAWQVRFLTLCLCVKWCMIEFEWKRWKQKFCIELAIRIYSSSHLCAKIDFLLDVFFMCAGSSSCSSGKEGERRGVALLRPGDTDYFNISSLQRFPFLLFLFSFGVWGGGVEKIECIVQWMNEMYIVNTSKKKKCTFERKASWKSSLIVIIAYLGMASHILSDIYCYYVLRYASLISF